MPATLGWFHKPCKPFYVGQAFGENKACVDIATNSKVISCNGLNPPAEYRSLYGVKGHLGIDIGLLHGANVHASREGIITAIDTNPKSGLDVRIMTEIQGRKFRHIYEHLLGYEGKIGDKVFTGKLIGWADNTGYASGDHLHFQLEEWLNGVWVPVDPMLYMSEFYATDVLWLNDKLKYITEQLAILFELASTKLRK